MIEKKITVRAPSVRGCNHRTPLAVSGMLLPAPPLAPRDAARVAICESVPGRFAQSPKRCSALVPGCPPCCDRRASGSFRGSSATNLAHPDRGQNNHPARSRESPPCLLRSRDARTKPVPCSSHFTLLTRPPLPARLADPKQRERGGCAAEFLGAGTQVVYAASRCGPLSPPPPQFHGPQRRSEQREGALDGPITMCSNQRGD